MPERPRVGIVQRRDWIAERGEWRDALDVRLARVIWEAGFVPIPLATGFDDLTDYLDALNLDAFVLSGGGDAGFPPERARLEAAILGRSERDAVPLLGICRGMQVIITACGGRLSPVEGHVSTRHLISGALSEEREVNSFHTLGTRHDELPETLSCLALAPDGTVEAVRHERLPWTAIMWHPEREHEAVAADLAIIERALRREVQA